MKQGPKVGRNPEEKGARSIEWAGQLRWEIGNNTVGLFSIANCEFFKNSQSKTCKTEGIFNDT